jgi:HlyD family secretion protein
LKDKGLKLLTSGLTPIILLAALVAIGAWMVRDSEAKKARAERENEQKAIATAPATVGNFEIVVNGNGKLEAVNSKKVNIEVDGQILHLAPNGSKVKKGDIIAMLDVPRMAKDLADQQNQYQNALDQLEKQKQDLGASVEQAQIDVEKAEKELSKFLAAQELDLKQKRAEKEYNEQDLLINKTRFERKRRLAGEKLVAQHEVEMGEANIKRREFDLERQRKDLELDEAKKASEKIDKQSAVDNAKASLERAKADRDEKIRNGTMKLQLSEQQLKRVKDQLSKALIKSPADGILVLEDYWERTDQRPYEEGDDAWENSAIATIPDLSKMRVALDIPQDQARLVKRKQKAIIRVEALPGIEFSGEVTELSQTAKEANNSFGPSSGERVFHALAEIKDLKKALLRPGMSCSLSIIIERLSKQLSIPLECVFDQDEKKIVYLQRKGRFEAVEVELGPQNATRIVVKKGLKPGDRVALRDVDMRVKSDTENKGKETSDLPF